MTPDNILVLSILGVAVVLFVTEKLRVDVVALLVLVAVIVTGLLTPEEALLGFASPAVVTVWSVFIISAGLFRSGIAEIMVRHMLRLAGRSHRRLLVVIMLTVGLMSAFMNNIGAVAILMPVVVSVARETNLSPSKLLIPLAFASLLGGNMTMIGTPPNILASSILESYGGIPSFSFFDFAPMGVIVLAAGIIYMLLVGFHLLPSRVSSEEGLAGDYPIQEYLAEAEVAGNSTLVDATVAQARLGELYDLNLIRIRRADDTTVFPTADRRLQAGDVLLLEGPVEQFLKASQAEGLNPLPGQPEGERPLPELQLVEVTLAPGSGLDGRTLKQANFRNRYGLTVMAIRQQGRSVVSGLADIPLKFGDAMLVNGPSDRINLLRRDPDFLVLETPPLELFRRRKAPLAIGIMVAVVVTITVGWLATSTAMLIGALLMVLSGTLSMDEAYEAIEWRSVFLIAGMLPMGLAMENTGTAQLLANQITALVGGLGPLAVLMGIFIMTALLTEVISNAAATVLVVPIAIDAARGLEADPRAFVMAVVLAASTSFLMPIGHQANVLVFGPGGYKFTDYTKVGVWLNLIILILVLLFLPLIWPLYP